jgi:hypothetical protein
MTKEFPNDANLERRDSDFRIFVIPSAFVIRISSLIGSCFIASKKYADEQEVEYQHIYAS